VSSVAGIELPPGDPGAVEDAAASFARASADFASTGQAAQRALRSVPGWAGVASITFRDRCGTYAGAAAAGKDACHQVAVALRRYGHELADAKAQVRDLQRQAEACVQRINAANQRAADAGTREGQAELRYLHAGAAGPTGSAAQADAQRDMEQAGADRRQAEQDAAAASGELDRLRRRAEQINERIRMQARVTAGAVDAAGGGLPRVDFPNAPAAAKDAGGGGFDWNTALLFFRLGTTASLLPAVAKSLPFIAAAQSWERVAPGSPLASWATQQMLEHFPTFNNGTAGGIATTIVGKLPKAGPLSDFLADAGRATPFFTKVGIGTGVIGTGLGGYHIYKDISGHKGGDQLATDITGTAFSGATVAFFVAPNPVTGGAVIVTGIAWGGAEAWQHRAAIGHGLKKAGEFAVDAGKKGAEFAWNTSAPGILYNNRHAIVHTLDSGVDLAGKGLSEAGSGLSKLGGALNPTHW
jgi:uncharacterized protein YukE